MPSRAALMAWRKVQSDCHIRIFRLITVFKFIRVVKRQQRKYVLHAQRQRQERPVDEPPPAGYVQVSRCIVRPSTLCKGCSEY